MSTRSITAGSPSATFDFTDIERIEVLRGPQGTLYGKNTTAGAINITTRKPSFTPEARIELTTGNYQFIQAKASVSGPLIPDKLAIRLSASVTERDGTIYNVVTGKNLNAQDNIGVRGQLLWKPTETLDFALSGDYSQQNPDCCVQYYVRTGATQRPLNRQYAALAAAQGYVVPSTNAFDRVTDVDTPICARSRNWAAFRCSAIWDLGAGDDHVGQRVAVLGLGSVERSRLHRPADHHRVRTTRRSRPVSARSCASPRTASTRSITCSARSISTRRSIRRACRSRGRRPAVPAQPDQHGRRSNPATC